MNEEEGKADAGEDRHVGYQEMAERAIVVPYYIRMVEVEAGHGSDDKDDNSADKQNYLEAIV